MKNIIVFFFTAFCITDVVYSWDFSGYIGLGQVRSVVKSHNIKSTQVNAPAINYGIEKYIDNLSIISNIRNSRYFFSKRSRARHIELQLGSNYYFSLFYVGGGISYNLFKIENDKQDDYKPLNYKITSIASYFDTGIKYKIDHDSSLKLRLSHSLTLKKGADRDIRNFDLSSISIDLSYIKKIKYDYYP